MAFAKIVIIAILAGLCEVRGQTGDVFKVLDKSPNLRKFRAWCEPMRGFFTGNSELTVFAFNDSSYNSMPFEQRKRLDNIANDDNLKRMYVMTYTILDKVTMSELQQIRGNNLELSRRQTSNGNYLFISNREYRQFGTSSSVGATYTYINGARILDMPTVASNGLVYTLDRPPDLPSRLNVYEWIMAGGEGTGTQTARFKEKVIDKVSTDYYASTIQPITGKGVTFFLPSEDALSRIPQQELDALSFSELANKFKFHYIPDQVIYTSFVNHQESAKNGAGKNVLFLRNDDKVVIRSGGVTASVVKGKGNITVSNGVIHVIDTMFGLIYNSLTEQIRDDCPQFYNLVRDADPQLSTIFNQNQDINMFVPNDEAINRVRNLVNINQNRTLQDYILRWSMIKNGAIEVSRLNGNYAVRQHRISWYRDQKLVIYNDRNETWVNGGHVRAKIVKPDIETKTGRMQIIDAVLGVPSMDIPNLIYYDDYLLLTYWDIQSVGLVEYIEDPRFDKTSLPPRNFDRTGTGNNMYGMQTTTLYPGQQYPTQYPGQRYPGQQNTQYPTQYPGQQNTQYPNNQYPQNQYPNSNSPYGPRNQISSYGKCRDFSNVCQFTYFVPNGSAIWQYKMTSYGRQISLNPNLYRYILRRTLVLSDTLFYLEDLQPGQREYPLYTHTGETIYVRKENENLARILWAPADRPGTRVSAEIIMWDLGATNGVVHIINNVLSQSSDLSIDPNGATTYTASIITLLMCVILALLYKR